MTFQKLSGNPDSVYLYSQNLVQKSHIIMPPDLRSKSRTCLLKQFSDNSFLCLVCGLLVIIIMYGACILL